jgi:hypothetical protein
MIATTICGTDLYDTDDRETLSFTMRGIKSLRELIADQKR